MTTIYYYVDRAINQATFAGPMPETWEKISGLTPENYADARDLHWAGSEYAAKGFLTYQDALNQGIPQVVLDDLTQTAYDFEWERLTPIRSQKIDDIRWRIDRYNDYIRQGLTPPEPIEPLDAYVQAIRDLTTVYNNPFDIVWPTVPPEPV